MKKTAYLSTIIASCLTLTACGGSGGSSPPPTPPTGDTAAPQLAFAPDSLTVESGQTATSTFTATDNVGITTGPDISCTNGGSFAGSTFTSPVVTADTTSVCTATARDAAGNSGTATLTVTITPPPNEAPTFSGNTQFSQDESKIEEFAVSISDPEGDTLITTVLSADDGAMIEFDAVKNVVRFKSAPNFEDPEDTNTDNVYAFTLQASDGENTVTQEYELTVTDIPEGLALTGKVTLGPRPSEPDTTSQTDLKSIGDWTGDGHSDLMIKRGEFNVDLSDDVENIFIFKGKTVFDTADSNIAVKDLQTGIRIAFNGLSAHHKMTATPVADVSGDGVMDIYLYVMGNEAPRGFILDSSKLIPLLNSGGLSQATIGDSWSNLYGIEIVPEGDADEIKAFFEDLSFIDDVSGDAAPDILHCQAVLTPTGDAAGKRSFVLGSQLISQALMSQTNVNFVLNPGAGTPATSHRVFIESNVGFGGRENCDEAAGDIDGDGLGDFLYGGTRIDLIWGHAIAGLMGTGGTLIMEDLATSGKGVYFAPQVSSMRANTVGDMNEDGRADFYIEDFLRQTSDGEPVYNTYHIFGMPQSLLARYPNGEINPRTLQSSERFASVRAYVDFAVFDHHQFRQWFAEGEPVDIDQDGQFEWLSVGTRHSPDLLTPRHFHFEPAEFDKLGFPYSGGAENSVKDFEYPRDICCGTPPEFFIMRGFAKDIDNDNISELLGEKNGTSFILSGAKVQENIDNYKVLDLTSVFPELFEANP